MRFAAPASAPSFPRRVLERRSSKLAFVACVLVAVVVQVRLYRHTPFTWTDLGQDYSSARELVEGRDPYAPTAELVRRHVGEGSVYWTEDQRNPHTPAQIVLTAPFSVFPFRFLRYLVLLTSMIAAAMAMFLAARELGFREEASQLIGVTTLALPLIHDGLKVGQVDSYLLLGAVLAWRALRRGRNPRAGVLLGILAAVKIFPVLLLLPLWKSNHRRALVWGVLTAASVSLVAGAAVGLGTTWRWLRVVAPADLEIWGAADHNISVPGVILRLVYGSFSSSPAWAPALYAGLLMVGVLLASRGRDMWDAAPWVVVFPLAWAGYALLTLPLFLAYFRQRISRPLVLATFIVLAGGARLGAATTPLIGTVALITLGLVTLSRRGQPASATTGAS